MTPQPLAPPTRPDPAPASEAVVVAVALGVGTGLLVLLQTVVLVLMTGDDGQVDAAAGLLLLLPAGQLTAAVLLARRRSWLVLALACLPGLLGSVLVVAQDPSFAPGPYLDLLFHGGTLAATLRRDVRAWVRGRTRR